MKITGSQHRRSLRRAAVAVEFAFIAPLLISIAMGIIELSRTYEAQNMLETACREGARFASMDRDGMLQDGQTTNSKVIQDVKHFLASNGLPAENIEVRILDAENPSEVFDLDDPANEMQLFKVEIEIPFSAVSFTPVSESHDFGLIGAITFRNGHATLSQ